MNGTNIAPGIMSAICEEIEVDLLSDYGSASRTHEEYQHLQLSSAPSQTKKKPSGF